MAVRDIYFYVSIQSWSKEEPDATIRGNVSAKGENWIEIVDESNLHQIINLDRLFAVVY